MKKDIFNVNLITGLVANDNHKQEKLKNGDFGHKREGITIIKAIDLSVSLCHWPSSKIINFTIWPNFNGINLFSKKEIYYEEQEELALCTTMLKILYFNNHCLLPFRMMKSSIHISRSNDKRQRENKAGIGRR